MQDCSSYCVSTLRLTWNTWGEQLIELERSCGPVFGSVLDEVACTVTNNGVFTGTRDCIFACQGDRCNGNDNDLMLEFSTLDEEGNPQEMSCYTFDSEIDDPNQPDGKFIECPIYSNHGCFKARGYWTPGDENSIRYYKGCSAYPFDILGQQGLTVSLVTMNSINHSKCYFSAKNLELVHFVSHASIFAIAMGAILVVCMTMSSQQSLQHQNQKINRVMFVKKQSITCNVT